MPASRPVPSSGPVPAPRASEAEEEYSAPARDAEEGGLIGFITRRNRVFAASLDGAGVREDEDSVDLMVGPQSAGFLNIKRGIIEGLCEEYYKRRMRLNILTGAPEEKAAPEKIKEADPLVKDAVRILEGRVI
ncbi:MAG: hypothetical protein A2W38_03305 [Deltaproteobacteria bacterium RBG_19FT_COMBO_58_16]|nr:MAG: hypothetical protein A2W38_03305 [Deltaproteobacteria bacterium RBG_19FT_COMBO_58_16]